MRSVIAEVAAVALGSSYYFLSVTSGQRPLMGIMVGGNRMEA